MKLLSEYIIVAFIASLTAGIAEKLSPSSSSVSKYVSFVASLVLLLLLVSPLKSLGDELLDFAEGALPKAEDTEPSERSYEALLQMAEERAEGQVKAHLAEEFAIDEDITVTLDLEAEDEGTVLLTRIEIILPQAYSELALRIEEYMENTFRTETSVSVSGHTSASLEQSRLARIQLDGKKEASL